MRSPYSDQHGFTLIEMLVVVTIIVVLLALLAPALDKAIYQAELAVCGARMKGITTGASSYAFDFKRFYPKRDVIDLQFEQPYTLAHDAAVIDVPTGGTIGVPTGGTAGWVDDRPTMRTHIPINMVADPLSPKIKLDVGETPGASSWVHSGMSLYFGVTFRGYAGMKRLGDRFAFQDARTTFMTHRYSLLVADLDLVTIDGQSISGHPDEKGLMTVFYSSGNGFYTSRFQDSLTDGVFRGKLDLNYGYADGGVHRLTGVEVEDDRIATVPYRADHLGYPSVWVQLPKE